MARSPCAVAVRGWASPALVTLGDFVNVRYQLGLHCPERPRPFNLAIVAEGDAADPDGTPPFPVSALPELVDAMALASNPGVRLGITVHGNRGGVACALTGDPAAAAACAARVARGEGPTESPRPLPPQDALALAVAQLVAARQARSGGADPSREAVLLVMRPDSAPCAGLAAAADDVTAAGIELGIACAGDCASSCLPSLATPGSYYTASGWPDAVARHEQLAWSSAVRVAMVTVRDILAANMEVDPTTFDPPGAVYRAAEKSVAWLDHDVRDRHQVSFAYATRPVAPGSAAVSVYGDGWFTDTLGRSGSFRLPRRTVTAATAVTRIYSPFLLADPVRVLPLVQGP